LHKFETLSHGILLYNSAYDDTYFVTRFLGGLKEEIRSVIALHRTTNVLTASSLALLQESELESNRSRGVPKEFSRSFSKHSGSTDRPKHTPSEQVLQPKSKPDKLEQDDKLKSLMQHRKKNGLCYKCGEKWSHNHKCPAQVSLHVIEELFDALQPPESETEGYSSSEDEPEPAVVLAVTSESLVNPCKRRTMRFQGCVDNKEVTILVDSGSSGTFVSSELFKHLNWPVQECPATQYAAANGNQMTCNSMLKGFQWTT